MMDFFRVWRGVMNMRTCNAEGEFACWFVLLKERAQDALRSRMGTC